MIESQTSYLRAATNIAMQLVAFFTCFANHKQFVSWAILGAGLCTILGSPKQGMFLLCQQCMALWLPT